MTIISIQLYVEVPVAIDMLGRWCLALSLISHGSTILRIWICICENEMACRVFYKV